MFNRFYYIIIVTSKGYSHISYVFLQNNVINKRRWPRLKLTGDKAQCTVFIDNLKIKGIQLCSMFLKCIVYTTQIRS